MGVIISEALRYEVLEAAKRLLPKATENLEQMYRSHARRRLRRPLRRDEEEKIKRQVSEMLSI